MRHHVSRNTVLLMGLVLLLALLAGCGRQQADPPPPAPPDENSAQTGGDPVPPANIPTAPAPEGSQPSQPPENPGASQPALENEDAQSSAPPEGQTPPAADSAAPPESQPPADGQPPEDSQPSGADPTELPPAPETPSAPEDGAYTAAVTLAGGSGRASVSSPAQLRCENGQFWATVIWSSPNFDYMKVDGVKYELISTGGNSTFEIPVIAFDRAFPVIADTIAMSEPHEVEYTLTFDSATLEKQ